MFQNIVKETGFFIGYYYYNEVFIQDYYLINPLLCIISKACKGNSNIPI